MSLKKIVVSLVGVSVASFSLTTFATTLLIKNYTNQDSTSVTNGKCSVTEFGALGITPHKTATGPGKNYVPEFMLKKICKGAEENCVSIIYMNNKCTAPAVAKVTFSVTHGLVSVDEIYDHNYYLEGGGFDVSIKGGH